MPLLFLTSSDVPLGDAGLSHVQKTGEVVFCAAAFVPAGLTIKSVIAIIANPIKSAGLNIRFCIFIFNFPCLNKRFLSSLLE